MECLDASDLQQGGCRESEKQRFVFSIDLLSLRIGVMGQTQLFVWMFLFHPSTAAEPVLVIQTWICLGVCQVVYLPEGAPTQLMH